jgi:hypothetical protein
MRYIADYTFDSLLSLFTNPSLLYVFTVMLADLGTVCLSTESELIRNNMQTWLYIRDTI